MGIGFAGEDGSPFTMPGWELHSVGYYSNDGCAYVGRGIGRPYGPCFETGGAWHCDPMPVSGCSLRCSEMPDLPSFSPLI